MADEDLIAVETMWRSLIQTTDAPRLTPHDIWTPQIRLHGSTPLGIASVIQSEGMLSWAFIGAGADRSSELVGAEIAIRPWGWRPGEDRIDIRTGGLRSTFADRALLDSPRSNVEVLAPDTTRSGSFIPILAVPAHNATFGLLAINADDTEVRRWGRWRLRPDMASVIDLRFAALASGPQSGSIPG